MRYIKYIIYMISDKQQSLDLTIPQTTSGYDISGEEQINKYRPIGIDFISACRYGNLESIQNIIEMNKLSLDSDICIEGAHISVKYDKDKIIKYLLEKGLDVNCYFKDSNNCLETLLTLSAKYNKINIANLLLQHTNINIDLPNITNYDPRTPLLHAINKRNPDMAKLLIDSGANINLGENFTPIMEAIFWDLPETSLLLIDRGVDLNFSNVHGNTPLIYAIDCGQIIVANHILEKGLNRGLDLVAVNKQGKSALGITLDKKYYHLAIAFIRLGVKPNSKTNIKFDGTLKEFMKLAIDINSAMNEQYKKNHK